MKEKVLIAGLGRSGFAAAKLLAQEAELTAWDSKSEDNFDAEALTQLRALGVSCVFGDEPKEHFDRAVLSPGIPLDSPLALHLKEDGCFISGELEEAFARCPGTFFAVTGTNGKTTTVSLIAEIVKAAKIDCRLVGNIGLPVAEECLEAGPDTVMVTEVSSFQLETIHTFAPHVSAILNITPDHLNRHKTFEEYARVKSLIFENQLPGDYFIYNAEDRECAALAALSPCAAIPFSISREFETGCFVRNGEIVIAEDGCESILCRTDELKIPGTHNIENALAAAAVSYFGGIPEDAIAEGLRSFIGVEHRMELVRELDGVRYINDSKGTNPDSTIKAVEAVNTPIVLIAGGYEKNSDYSVLVDSFGAKVKKLVLMGATAERFAECAAEHGVKKEDIIMCASMDECVKTAHDISASGDTVLLSPASASWDMYKNFEERGDHFKQLVSEL